MKKILSLIFLSLLTLALVACGGKKEEATKEGGETKQEARVIKVTTKFVDDEQTAKSLVKVVDAINQRSNGTLELQLFTSGTLPIGKDGMEQVANGSDWILVDGVNFLGDYIPDYNAVTGPMLYQTFEEYLRMVKTPLVQDLNAQALEKGIKVLSLDWLFGFRNIEAKKPIKTPEDMKGLKLRVPTSQLYTFTIEAMGGNPVAMPYPDTYAALQQGVIDGLEGSILSFYGTKQYENVKEYSLTRHLLGVSAVCISKKCWDSLTDEQRTIIQEEFDKGALDNLTETQKLEDEYAQKLKENGIEFAIATGRSFNSANKIRKKIGLEIYLICNNGANIYNKNGNMIKNNVMPADLIRKVIKFLTENNIGYFAFDGSGINFYVPANMEIDAELLKEHIPHYIKNLEDIENLPALEKILIIEEDTERIYEIKDLIHNKFDSELEIVISADDCLDLNIKGCSKRGGVEYISQELKINPKEIMAFGDSGNDYKMLKFVGHPVAMKDSFMAKRDFENKTDFTNDESGVAKYLQKYFNL